MVQSVKFSVPSIIRPVRGTHMVRPLSRSGLTSTLPLYPQERWVLVPGTRHLTITEAVGIGRRFSDLVSLVLSLHLCPKILL